MAMTASISVPPAPPSVSGSVMPISPCACMRLAMSKGKRGSCARLSASGASSARANLRTDSANMVCSSVKLKFIDDSVLLGARLLHHRRPLDLLVIDVGGIFLRRGEQRLGAVLGHALFGVGRADRLAQRRRELVDDRPRRAGRRDDSIMQHGLEAGHA